MKRMVLLLLALCLACGVLLTACGEEKEGSTGAETSGGESSGAASVPGTYTEGLKFFLAKDGESYTVADVFEATDTEVVIPATHEGLPVTGINNNAFTGCKEITSVVIPDGVQRIGIRVFADCTGLTAISIGSGVTEIGSGAFRGCSGLTNVVIPAGVTEIEEYLFADCTALNGITIPKGVTSIGAGAFSKCDSLTVVRYGGSPEDWAKIDIGENNDALRTADVVFGA